MEARDTSGTSLGVGGGGREGSVEEEGKGGMMPVTAALAKDAALLFQSRRFAECTGILNQILQKKADDPKVLHNIAIAEYFRDDCSDPKKLLDVLKKVKRRSEELARASRAQVEISGNTGANPTSGSRGSGITLHQFSAANTACIAYADVFDTSIMTLNMAVVLYHLHEYAISLSLLESLYQNIEPIDETTALHVCLLLLDVALASKDASRAANVIQYLERAFGVGYMLSQEDSGAISQHSSSNQIAKFSMSSSGLAASDVTSSDSGGIVNTSEPPLTGSLPDDAIEYENLLSTLDNSGENLKKQVSNDLLKTSADITVSAIDLKLKLQLYKVQFLLLIRNLKAAKREIKLAMNNSRGRDSSKALLLKAQLEYARGNHRKAIKLLGNRTEAGISSMLSNNLGCIYHQLKKHHSSTLLFAKALKSSSSLRGEKPLTLYTFAQDKSLLIVYNCGLEYLFCGRPLEAAHCFYKASPLFRKQPLVWLRIAECCLLAQEKGLLKLNGTSSSHAEEVQVHVIGTGKLRQLSIDSNSRSRTLDTVAEDGSVTKDGQCRLSVPLARTCLVNALHLLNGLEVKVLKTGAPVAATEEEESNEGVSLNIKSSNRKSTSMDCRASNATTPSALAVANSENQEMKGGHGSNMTFPSSVSSYEDILREEKHMIKQAVLANLAYVELCLENPLKALSAAKTLLQLYDCSRIYVFLGHVYAAEALCRLNRPKEASEFLSVYVSSDGTVELPYSEENIEKWSMEKGGDSEELNVSATVKTTCIDAPHKIQFLSPEDAQGLLYVNLASMFAMQGKLDEAIRCVMKAISIIPNNPRALLAAVYVDLLLGKTQDAISKLKCCSGLRFLSSTVPLRNS